MYKGRKYKYKFVKRTRFGYKIGCSQFFGQLNCSCMCRSRKYNDRNMFDICVLFNGGQKLLSVHYGHVKIQEDDIG